MLVIQPPSYLSKRGIPLDFHFKYLFRKSSNFQKPLWVSLKKGEKLGSFAATGKTILFLRIFCILISKLCTTREKKIWGEKFILEICFKELLKQLLAGTPSDCYKGPLLSRWDCARKSQRISPTVVKLYHQL